MIAEDRSRGTVGVRCSGVYRCYDHFKKFQKLSIRSIRPPSACELPYFKIWRAPPQRFNWTAISSRILRVGDYRDATSSRCWVDTKRDSCSLKDKFSGENIWCRANVHSPKNNAYPTYQLQRSWDVVCDKSDVDNSWQLTKAPTRDVRFTSHVRFNHETDVGRVDRHQRNRVVEKLWRVE